MTHFVLQNMLNCWLNSYFISYGHNEMIFYVMCQFVYSEQGTLMTLLSLSSVVKVEQEMNLKLSDPWSAKEDHKYWGTGHKKYPDNILWSCPVHNFKTLKWV